MPGKNLTRTEAEARSAIVALDSYKVTLDLTFGLMSDPPTFRSTTVVKFGDRKGESTFIDLIAPAVHAIMFSGAEFDPAKHFEDSRISLPNLQHANQFAVCAKRRKASGGDREARPVCLTSPHAT